MQVLITSQILDEIDPMIGHAEIQRHERTAPEAQTKRRLGTDRVGAWAYDATREKDPKDGQEGACTGMSLRSLRRNPHC